MTLLKEDKIVKPVESAIMVPSGPHTEFISNSACLYKDHAIKASLDTNITVLLSIIERAHL